MEIEPTSLDWELLFSGTLVFLKVLLGVYGVPISPDMSQVEMPTKAATYRLVAVYRVEEPEFLEQSADVLERRVASEAESVTTHIDLRSHTISLDLELPHHITQDSLIPDLGRPGRLRVTHNNTELLGPGDFLSAERRVPDGVFIKLTESATTKFAGQTELLTGKETVVELDGEVLMRPVIREAIKGGELVLSGANIDAELLIRLIPNRGLPTKLELLEVKTL